MITWKVLIELAELRLHKLRLKSSQLEALIEVMKNRDANKEPSPGELMAIKSDLKILK